MKDNSHIQNPYLTRQIPTIDMKLFEAEMESQVEQLPDSSNQEVEYFLFGGGETGRMFLYYKLYRLEYERQLKSQ